MRDKGIDIYKGMKYTVLLITGVSAYTSCLPCVISSGFTFIYLHLRKW
jgi:hypothetical protein